MSKATISLILICLLFLKAHFAEKIEYNQVAVLWNPWWRDTEIHHMDFAPRTLGVAPTQSFSIGLKYRHGFNMLLVMCIYIWKVLLI